MFCKYVFFFMQFVTFWFETEALIAHNILHHLDAFPNIWIKSQFKQALAIFNWCVTYFIIVFQQHKEQNGFPKIIFWNQIYFSLKPIKNGLQCADNFFLLFYCWFVVMFFELMSMWKKKERQTYKNVFKSIIFLQNGMVVPNTKKCSQV